MGSIIKNVLIAVVLIGALYFGYVTFFSGNDSQLLVGSGSSESQLVANEFLVKLNELQGINFSRDLFEDARFRSFVSFSTEPESVASGRSNPFSR